MLKDVSQRHGISSGAFGSRRAGERVNGVHHTTVIHWLKQVGERLPDSYAPDQIPNVGELDELETFVGAKKTRFGSGRQLVGLDVAQMLPSAHDPRVMHPRQAQRYTRSNQRDRTGAIR